MHSRSEAQHLPQQFDLLSSKQKRGQKPIIFGNGPSALVILEEMVEAFLVHRSGDWLFGQDVFSGFEESVHCLQLNIDWKA